jgi:hypothetical protein
MQGLTTAQDRAAIITASLAAAEAGDEAEEFRLLRLLPMAPHLVLAAKEVYGIEYVKNSGWDLSEAYAELGEGWLEQ